MKIQPKFGTTSEILEIQGEILLNYICSDFDIEIQKVGLKRPLKGFVDKIYLFRVE